MGIYPSQEGIFGWLALRCKGKRQTDYSHLQEKVKGGLRQANPC
jgi:hypothetical protein